MNSHDSKAAAAPIAMITAHSTVLLPDPESSDPESSDSELPDPELPDPELPDPELPDSESREDKRVGGTADDGLGAS